jgi:hypothetical protein
VTSLDDRSPGNRFRDDHHDLDGRRSQVDPHVARINKYKSWDSEREEQKTFDSYKKLITPGFYGARGAAVGKLSKSHDELRYFF